MTRPFLAVLVTSALLVLVLLLVAAVASARAATIAVNTINDDAAQGDGLCSLRKAIDAVDSPGAPDPDCAAAAFGSNTIVLPPGTFTLNPHNSPSELTIASTVNGLTITGDSVANTTISGAGATTVLAIAGGASVSITNLTITRGQAEPGAPAASTGTAGAGGTSGGAIVNAGNVTLSSMAITDSDAGNGGAGGPAGRGGDGGNGGAIYNTGTLAIAGVTLAGNGAGQGAGGGSAPKGSSPGAGGSGGTGGAIANHGGTLTVTASTLVDNAAGNGGAGGAGAKPNGSAGGAGGGGGYGGALSSANGSVSIVNSTLAGNTSGSGATGGTGGATNAKGAAGGPGGDGGDGGAIGLLSAVTATLVADTLAGNGTGAGGAGGAGGSAPTPGAAGADAGAGAGGALADPGQHLSVQDTLLASNAGGNCDAPSLINAGHDLSFGGSGCPATFLNADPDLGPLQSNGGPTETIELGFGSAAIDQVPRIGGGCPATDQRGVPRPGGPACDIGAYEVVAPLVSTGVPSLITARAVTVGGSATAYSGQGTVSVQYGTSTAYGLSTTPVEISGISSQPASITLGGLRPHTTYFYRFVASTLDGTSYGQPLALSTDVPTLRGLTIRPATLPRGGAAIVSYRVSEASLTTFTLLRCVPRRGRHQHGCARYVSMRSFSRRDSAGRDRFRFGATLQGGRLPRGSYMLRATPSAGIAIGVTISVGFRVGG